MDEPRRVNFGMMARMLRASLGLSLRRLIHSPVLLANLGIAALPLVIVLVIVTATWSHPFIRGIAGVNGIYEKFLGYIYLQFIVFFIANIMGSAVMRQEREEQTLHYLFLQPVRRWMIIAGKLGAYLIVSSAVCVGSLWLTYLALGLPFCGVGDTISELFVKGRALILARDSLVLMLGLLAYGTFALLMGSFFKNATYALFLLAWEAGLPYLPSTLKFWTFAHYLHSLLPIHQVEEHSVFELWSEPATIQMSLIVLLTVPCLFTALAIWHFRYRECLYGET